jgi:hypothetical protein
MMMEILLLIWVGQGDGAETHAAPHILRVRVKETSLATQVFVEGVIVAWAGQGTVTEAADAVLGSWREQPNDIPDSAQAS